MHGVPLHDDSSELVCGAGLRRPDFERCCRRHRDVAHIERSEELHSQLSSRLRQAAELRGAAFRVAKHCARNFMNRSNKHVFTYLRKSVCRSRSTGARLPLGGRFVSVEDRKPTRNPRTKGKDKIPQARWLDGRIQRSRPDLADAGNCGRGVLVSRPADGRRVALALKLDLNRSARHLG